MRLKHLLGPQRLRQTTLEGQEEQFHFDHITLPPGQHSATLRGPPEAMVPPVGKESPKYYKTLPGRPTRVSPHGDHWVNLWGSTARDQIGTEKGDRT